MMIMLAQRTCIGGSCRPRPAHGCRNHRNICRVVRAGNVGTNTACLEHGVARKSPNLAAAAVILALTLGLSPASALAAPALHHDICNASDTGFTKPDQQAVACYGGNFLVKMLSELNAGEDKTAEHVRVHLLPYLGGTKTLDALLTDDMNQAQCILCFKGNEGTKEALTGLRNSLTQEQITAYDRLSPCYHTLTNRIMAHLPKDDRGLLLARMPHLDPFKQVVQLFEKLFASDVFDAGSCKIKGGMTEY